MFRWDIVGQYLFSGLFISAAWTTLWIAVISQISGVIIGLFLALMRMSRHRWLSLPARFYVWIFRGSPLLVQLLLLYFGIPEVFPGLVPYITVYNAAIIAFSFNEGAYMSEIVRAGISSVDPGQMEAAKSLGMPGGAPARGAPVSAAASERAYLLCLRPLGALACGEFDPLVLLQTAETISAWIGGVVNQDVGGAVVGGDESIALVSVEPLHGALSHVLSPTETIVGIHGCVSRVAATVCLRRLHAR